VIARKEPAADQNTAKIHPVDPLPERGPTGSLIIPVSFAGQANWAVTVNETSIEGASRMHSCLHRRLHRLLHSKNDQLGKRRVKQGV
jgi:hypothetical protein